MRMSVKLAALALGLATLSAATVLPAAAKCIMSQGDCGSTAAGIAAATMGSAASSSASAASGAATLDRALSALGLPPDEILRGLAELQKLGLYYNYGHEKRGEPAFIGPDGHFVPDLVDPPVYRGGDGSPDKKDQNNEAKVLKPGKGEGSTVTVNVNASRKAPPTTTAGANASGGAMNASSYAVSNTSLDHSAASTVPAPKKPAPKTPVTVRIISASTQAQATAQQPVAHSQPFGPVGSSSLNARQKALGAGSR